MTTVPLTNWARNVRFRAEQLHRPSSIAELQQLVSRSARVRALGTGHSFNEIADTTGDLVSVAGLPTRLDIDAQARTVTVSGGTRFAELGRELHQAGFAIPNTASLPHISVAGGCSTGTHGSGETVGNLSSFVSAVELVTADGDLITCSRETDPDRFDGTVVALGALGIVTALTFDLVPTFHLRQDVYDGLAHESFLAGFDEIMAAGYSVSAFSTWREPRIQQIWVKSRTDPADNRPAAPTLHGASLATGERHPLQAMSPEYTTPQLGVPGPWNERLPHFRAEFTPSAGEEIQSEYLLPREHALAAIDAVRQRADRIAPLLQVCEIRTIAADDLWMSTAYGRDSVGVHFTWTKEPAAVEEVLVDLEPALAPLGARPHWGKLFLARAEQIAPLYERYADFVALVQRLDPRGAFRNDWFERHVLGSR